MKCCSRCKVDKELSAFTRYTRSKDGYKYYCKACHSAYVIDHRRKNPEVYKAWARANKDKLKSSQLKGKYGITLEEHDVMLKEQGGKCGLCGTSEPRGQHHQWYVDHDHTLNVVRGLLCHGCNTGIGLLKDDPTLLRAAADYIEFHREKNRRAA